MFLINHNYTPIRYLGEKKNNEYDKTYSYISLEPTLPIYQPYSINIRNTKMLHSFILSLSQLDFASMLIAPSSPSSWYSPVNLKVIWSLFCLIHYSRVIVSTLNILFYVCSSIPRPENIRYYCPKKLANASYLFFLRCFIISSTLESLLLFMGITLSSKIFWHTSAISYTEVLKLFTWISPVNSGWLTISAIKLAQSSYEIRSNSYSRFSKKKSLSFWN